VIVNAMRARANRVRLSPARHIPPLAAPRVGTAVSAGGLNLITTITHSALNLFAATLLCA
jgi:hypothetical protein